jgi:hypothetical protein
MSDRPRKRDALEHVAGGVNEEARDDAVPSAVLLRAVDVQPVAYLRK